MKSSSFPNFIALCFIALAIATATAAPAVTSEAPQNHTGLHESADVPAASDAAVQAHATRLSPTTIGAGTLAMIFLLAGAHHYSRTGMQRWNVNSRLAAGFTCILAVLAGLALESYVSLHSAFEGFTEYRSDAHRSTLAGEIHSHYLEMRIAAKDLIVFRNQEAAQRYTTHKTALLTFLKEAQASIQEPQLIQKLQAIETGVERHAALHLELQKAVFAEQTTAATDINNQMGTLGAVIGSAADDINAEFFTQQNEEGPRISAALQHTQSAVVWLGIAAVVLGVALALIIGRSITGPLRQLAE